MTKPLGMQIRQRIQRGLKHVVRFLHAERAAAESLAIYILVRIFHHQVQQRNLI